jgi:hypothetical protein
LFYQNLSDAQAKQVIGAEQAYEAWQDAWRLSRSWVGGMHWKTVAGREYPYRTRDSKGNAKSLGVRCLDTEKIAADFHVGKQASQQRLKSLKAALQTQAKI